MEAPAAPGEFRAVHLFMQEPGAGGHPLHFALADAAAVAGGVFMVDFAVEHQRHGLEAAMRMPADAARLVGGREVRRAGMVEQQERRKLRVALIVEHGVDGETVADPVPFGLAVDAEDVFHDCSMEMLVSGIKWLFMNKSSR
jgi:hypothetical protein